MSLPAQPSHAVSAQADFMFAPLQAQDLDAVLQIEQSAYAHPWTRTNFLDTLEAGYQAQALHAEGQLLGYFVAMQGVDEVHLLNITVAPAHQGQGWAGVIMDAMHLWARSRAAQWSWLEVRVGNLRAMRLYTRHGYSRVGQRKNYYPASHGQREDAVVMSLQL
jgi:ribosomal-protein-alanine N-acetyltransferase